MKDDLDMSWINDYSRMHTIQQIMNKEELDSIVLQTIYMNKNQEITKIDKENIKLNNNNSKRYISKEQLLQIVQTKKIMEKNKYKLLEILLLSLHLDPIDIQKYVNGECSEIIHLKSIPIINDVNIPPSLFIFHSLHTFYLFFTEIDIDTPTIKSILKPSQQDNIKIKHTKKVRIAESENTVIAQKIHKKTRKIWSNTVT
jgi:hypothetical protein